MALNNAIVCLTRGYKSNSMYLSLIVRNQKIEEFLGNKYPLIIFQEGNITTEQQDYIKSKTPNLQINFVDISDIWAGGYEGMCRFQTYDLWNICSNLDYIMRIDEDCHLKTCEIDPFSVIGDNVYLRSVYFAESHSETNATLPQKIKQLTGAEPLEFYNDKFVYTNVSLSSVKFWLDKIEMLKEIATCKEQRDNRWGDLPVLGSLLNIYAKGRVGYMPGLSYSHLSHGNIIVSNGVD